MRGLALGDWNGADAERRVMSEGTASAGGYLVPTPMSAKVLDLVRAGSAAMQLGAQTVPMDAPTLKIAKVDGDPTGYWRAENAAITASDLTIGAVTLTAKTLATRVKLSGELFEDGQGVSDVVANCLAQALAGELDRVVFTGSGSGAEPQGILNASGTNQVSLGDNGAALASYDDFLTRFSFCSNITTRRARVCVFPPDGGGAGETERHDGPAGDPPGALPSA